MKAKTIKSVLRQKTNEWIDSIDDPQVAEAARRSTIVTGGCIASMLLREPVNDYDIYFRNHKDALLIAKYYVAKFNAMRKQKADSVPVDIYVRAGEPPESDETIKIHVASAGVAKTDENVAYAYFEMRDDMEGAGYVEDIMEALQESATTLEMPKYVPVFLSTNAITLSNKIQLVFRFTGEPEQIHANYDFVHCTNYWTTKEGELVLHAEALESLLSRELRYRGSRFPICSIIRLRKFIARGWSINAGQIFKMCYQVSKLDLDDLSVLEDQLTGVDVAYFKQVLDKLKEKGDRVDSAYLMEIIERMF